MANREKVIKDLEEFIRDLKPFCGNHEDWKKVYAALDLLEEQEAKRPIYNNKKYGDYLPHCPSCEKVLPNISQYGFSKFCWACGQVMKWK